MAITIQKSPDILSPSENNTATWIVTSNLSNFVYFLVEVIMYGFPSQTLSTQKYYGRPDLLNGAVININPLLDSILDNPFVPFDNLIPYLNQTKNIASIQIKVTEYVVNASGQIVAQDGGTTFPLRYFWQGKLSPFELPDLSSFYFNTNNNGRFLTNNKLRFIDRNYEGSLSLLTYQNNSSFIETTIDEYEGDNLWSSVDTVLLNTWQNGDNQLAKRFHTVNTNISYVNRVYNNNMSPIGTYRFALWRGTTLLDSVVYMPTNNSCDESINVFWLNSYGAWESHQFINPYFSTELSRTNITTPSLKYSNYTYQDFTTNNNQKLINQSTKQINKEFKNKITVNTDDLSQRQLEWLFDLFHSNKIVIKYKGIYFPATIDDKSYSFQNQDQNYKTMSFFIQEL